MKLISALGLVACFATPVFAYVPPSQFIVKGVVAKKNGVKGIRVRSLVTAYDSEQPTNVRVKVTTLYEPEKNLIRSVAFDEISNAQLYVHERRTDTGDKNKEGQPVQAAIAALFDGKVERVTRTLLAQGLPIRTEQELLALKDEEARRAAELVRVDRRVEGRKRTIAWVIGAKDSKFQFWVEKDTFLPLNLWWEPENGRQILMENYRTFGELPFPRTVTLLEKKKVVFRDELIDLLVNPMTLAEFKAIKAANAAPLAVGFTEAGNKAPSAIRDLIQLYFETLR